MKRLLRLALSLALLSAGGGSLRAAPVLGNLSVSATDRVVPVSYNSWQASSFRLSESAGAWRVRSVTLRLAQDVPNAAFTVRIVGEASLRPALAAVVADFTLPAAISGATAPTSGAAAAPLVFPVAESPSPVLQPGRTYWLVVGVRALDDRFSPSTGLYYWSFANTSLTDAGTAAGWAFGTTSASAGTLGSGWTPETSTPFTFSVDAVPDIPPVTLANWRLTHPGGPEDTTEFLLTDLDHDGLNGLLEFAFNTSPSQPDPPNPIAGTDAQGRLHLTYTRWVNAPEIRYTVEDSSDLMNWAAPAAGTTETLVEPLADGRERVRVTWSGGGSRRFLRVQIQKL